MSYCRMAGKEEELNKLGVQRKINVAGSSNIEHSHSYFHLVSKLIKPLFPLERHRVKWIFLGEKRFVKIVFASQVWGDQTWLANRH